jgi:hypothetical protein
VVDVVPTRNGHWYSVSTYAARYQAASLVASLTFYYNLASYLVTITSASENAFVAQILSGTVALLGGLEYNQDGNWTWISGPEQWQPVSYTAWSPGVNFLNGNIECLSINGSTWGAQSCANELHFILEYCVVVNGTCARTLVVGTRV